MKNAQKPLLGFAAASGTGKTTLLVKLIPILKQQGFKVGLIKHSHHNFEIDKQGKDSYRLREAGASPVMLASSHRQAIITEFEEVIEPKLNQQLKIFEQSTVDLVLVEGFKAESFPKIELHRKELNKPFLYLEDNNIIAVASDTELSLPNSLINLNINNPKQVADFIIQRFLMQKKEIDECSVDHRMLTVETALENINANLKPINGVERKTIRQSLGRILAEDVYAPIDLPSDRTSAMDGYAFLSSDVSKTKTVVLKQVGTSWAGKPFLTELKKGECVRIFTGGVVPLNADSVVMQEYVRIAENKVYLPANCKTLSHVREIGKDVKQQDKLLNSGKKLTAADLGLLAASGLYDVAVKRKLRVAYFSTGDELISVGECLKTGQLYDSNRYILQGLLTDITLDAVDMGIIKDDKEALAKALIAAAKDYDVIITTGGASVGDADHIQTVLEDCGEVTFWKVAVKPGKPLAFGKIGECMFFGLPGNPASVLVAYDVFVMPALEKLAGSKPLKNLQLKAILQTKLKKGIGRKEYQRGILTQQEDGSLTVVTAGSQASNYLTVSSQANCYIVLEIDSTGAEIGDEVIIEPFSNRF